LFIKTYPKVPKGSTIMVLERKKSKSEKIKKGEPIDWNTAIEKGTVKLTALITVYLLFSRITIK
jgi:hypothetical protein